MGRLRVFLGLVGMVACVGACDALSSKSDANDDSAEDDGGKKKKKKKGNKDDDDKATETEDIDVNALFGKDASFGGSLDDYGDVMFGAVGHSPIEPDNFSAGWIGQESFDILKRARDGEFPHSQVRTADRRVCLVFKEGNTIRRAMLASTTSSPTEELAYASNGNLIFWYRHNRSKTDTFEDWAYFHQGQNLMLYQTRSRGGARQAENVSPELKAHILRGSRECVQAARASNRLPGSAPAPVPVPVTPQPTPGGGNSSGAPQDLHFGALAFSESAAAWRITYRKASEQDAKNEALAGCKQADCKIRATFTKGQCMSVVHGPAPQVTWGWANDNNTAQTNAIGECTKRGHGLDKCDVKGTWCNDG